MAPSEGENVDTKGTTDMTKETMKDNGRKNKAKGNKNQVEINDSTMEDTDDVSNSAKSTAPNNNSTESTAPNNNNSTDQQTTPKRTNSATIEPKNTKKGENWYDSQLADELQEEYDRELEASAIAVTENQEEEWTEVPSRQRRLKDPPQIQQSRTNPNSNTTPSLTNNTRTNQMTHQRIQQQTPQTTTTQPAQRTNDQAGKVQNSTENHTKNDLNEPPPPGTVRFEIIRHHGNQEFSLREEILCLVDVILAADNSASIVSIIDPSQVIYHPNEVPDTIEGLEKFFQKMSTTTDDGTKFTLAFQIASQDTIHQLKERNSKAIIYHLQQRGAWINEHSFPTLKTEKLGWFPLKHTGIALDTFKSTLTNELQALHQQAQVAEGTDPTPLVLPPFEISVGRVYESYDNNDRWISVLSLECQPSDSELLEELLTNEELNVDKCGVFIPYDIKREHQELHLNMFERHVKFTETTWVIVVQGLDEALLSSRVTNERGEQDELWSAIVYGGFGVICIDEARPDETNQQKFVFTVHRRGKDRTHDFINNEICDIARTSAEYHVPIMTVGKRIQPRKSTGKLVNRFLNGSQVSPTKAIQHRIRRSAQQPSSGWLSNRQDFPLLPEPVTDPRPPGSSRTYSQATTATAYYGANDTNSSYENTFLGRHQTRFPNVQPRGQTALQLAPLHSKRTLSNANDGEPTPMIVSMLPPVQEPAAAQAMEFDLASVDPSTAMTTITAQTLMTEFSKQLSDVTDRLDTELKEQRQLIEKQNKQLATIEENNVEKYQAISENVSTMQSTTVATMKESLLESKAEATKSQHEFFAFLMQNIKESLHESVKEAVNDAKTTSTTQQARAPQQQQVHQLSDGTIGKTVHVGEATIMSPLTTTAQGRPSPTDPTTETHTAHDKAQRDTFTSTKEQTQLRDSKSVIRESSLSIAASTGHSTVYHTTPTPETQTHSQSPATQTPTPEIAAKRRRNNTTPPEATMGTPDHLYDSDEDRRKEKEKLEFLENVAHDHLSDPLVAPNNPDLAAFEDMLDEPNHKAGSPSPRRPEDAYEHYEIEQQEFPSPLSVQQSPPTLDKTESESGKHSIFSMYSTQSETNASQDDALSEVTRQLFSENQSPSRTKKHQMTMNSSADTSITTSSTQLPNYQEVSDPANAGRHPRINE